MKRLLFALCLTSSLAATDAAETTPRIALEHKSFVDGHPSRNPFWPIGWTKPNPKNDDGAGATPLILPSSFTLTSVTTGGGDRFAILNGKVVQEGGKFGFLLGGQTYQVTVQSIRDGEIVLTYQGGEVVVPLRRH